jgi:hypothetical protein
MKINKKILLKIYLTTLIGYSASLHAEIKEQKCNADDILLVADELGLNNIKAAKDRLDQDIVTGIRSAACKVNPQNKDLMYVALASESNEKPNYNNEQIYDFTIATINTKKNTVVASYRGKLEEDATLRIDEYTLSIDTANYKLNEQTRAFGVDVKSDFSPSCTEGGSGSLRTLYIQEGKNIRPILNDLILSKWTYVVSPIPLCSAAVVTTPETSAIIEKSNISLSMAETKSNGFKDIIINVRKKVIDEEGKEISLKGKEIKEILPDNYDLKSYTYKVQYDGKKYPIEQ